MTVRGEGGANDAYGSIEKSEERREGNEECAEQFEVPQEVCEPAGDERYDPDFTPARFVETDAIGQNVPPNPCFPLITGGHWVHEAEDERVTVTVMDRIKSVERVSCRVVRDVVEEHGQLPEIADDRYAQDNEGNVWCCGQISQELEVSDGDDTEEPELVVTEGSRKAGCDGAKAGISALAIPRVGDVYREEVALVGAEDVAEVIDLAAQGRCRRRLATAQAR